MVDPSLLVGPRFWCRGDFFLNGRACFAGFTLGKHFSDKRCPSAHGKRTRLLEPILVVDKWITGVISHRLIWHSMVGGKVPVRVTTHLDDIN